MALGGWSRGVHWSSLGTARSGAGTEPADAWTESHSGVVPGRPVSVHSSFVLSL